MLKQGTTVAVVVEVPENACPGFYVYKAKDYDDVASAKE